MKYFNFLVETPDEAVERLDDIGGPHSHSNYPWGWAQAGNTPFKWYKQNTHEGGVHVPLIVHWPERITDGGALRDQFHHVNDIVPTIYETLGVEAPAVYRGFEQIPVPGISLALHRSTRPTQPGRKARPVLRDDGPPGHLRRRVEGGHPPPARACPSTTTTGSSTTSTEDRSECHDLAAEQPEQAGRAGRPVVAGGRGVRRAPPRRPHHRAVLHPLPRPLAPPDRPPLHLLPADVPAARPRRPRRSAGGAGTWRPPSTGPAGAGGVLYATGTENSGVSLFVQDDRLVFDYNCFGDHHVVGSERPGAGRPVGRSACGSGRTGQRRRGHPGHRRRRRAARSTCRSP